MVASKRDCRLYNTSHRLRDSIKSPTSWPQTLLKPPTCSITLQPKSTLYLPFNRVKTFTENRPTNLATKPSRRKITTVHNKQSNLRTRFCLPENQEKAVSCLEKSVHQGMKSSDQARISRISTLSTRMQMSLVWERVLSISRGHARLLLCIVSQLSRKDIRE